MNNRFRTILFIVLAVGQFAFARHYYSLRFTIDLLFLVIFFIAIRSGFMTSILSAALIGFCSDYLTGGVMGVFSFSRTLAAFFLNSLSRFLDLKKNIFIFPAHPGLPVPVEPGGLRLPGPDLPTTRSRSASWSSSPCPRPWSARSSWARKKRSPCWMYLSKRKLTPEFVKKAAVVSTILLVVFFTGMFVAFWSIQILSNDEYRQLAIRNITRTIDLPAPRGLIVDRSGAVLAENKINFTLYLVRENVENLEKTIRRASFFSGKSVAEIQQIIGKYKKYAMFYRIPIRSNLPQGTVIFIQSRQDEFPEFEIGMQPSRTFPLAESAAHVLGHLSEVSEAELDAGAPGAYSPGDVIGRSGIEKQYEFFLKGVKGSQTVIKNNVEKIQQVSAETEPEIGATVVLTLDLGLQRFCEELLGEENGVIGVLDLNSGGILALVSKPAVDPEVFSQEMTGAEWLAISNDPQKPLQNKFLQGVYSPGSVFKIVMALAGLQEKLIFPGTTVTCSGSQVFYDRVFHCWNLGGHGTMNLFSALQNSCNIYFYNLGRRMDIDTIARYARLLGLGAASGIDLPNENPGWCRTAPGSWRRSASDGSPARPSRWPSATAA